MAGLNRVFLIGNVGKEPETFGNGNVTKFSLATSDGFKDESGNNKTEWHSIVCFGKTAEFAAKYVKKGGSISVEGSIQYGKYENNNGVTVYTTDIVARNIIFTGAKTESGERAELKPKPFDASGDMSPGDLPF